MMPSFGKSSFDSNTVFIYFFDAELNFDYISLAAMILACIYGDYWSNNLVS